MVDHFPPIGRPDMGLIPVIHNTRQPRFHTGLDGTTETLARIPTLALAHVFEKKEDAEKAAPIGSLRLGAVLVERFNPPAFLFVRGLVLQRARVDCSDVLAKNAEFGAIGNFITTLWTKRRFFALPSQIVTPRRRDVLAFLEAGSLIHCGPDSDESEGSSATVPARERTGTI